MPTYSCARCGYSTLKPANLQQHELTKKHINLVQMDKTIDQVMEKTHECPKCRTMYSCYSTMHRHRKRCTSTDPSAVIPLTVNTDNSNNTNTDNSNNTTNNNINNVVNNNIGTMNQTVNQIIINQFINPAIVDKNINMLNEKCSKAKNLNEIMNSINVSPEFYEKFGHWDYKKCDEAYFDMLENRLNDLPITQRPLHSSKQPNEEDKVMYVRDADKWTAEQELKWSCAFMCSNEDEQKRWKSILNDCFTEFNDKVRDGFEQRRNTDCKKLANLDRISRNLTARLGPDAMLRIMSMLADLVNIETSISI